MTHSLATARANAEAATARYRLPLIAENILRNLHRVTDLPHRGVSLSGTVVVCGAGPSLNHAIPVLRERIGKVPIVAVNTAGPALAAAGIPVDVLVMIESLDLSAQIRSSGKVGTVVLDLAANPVAFDAAKEIGARVAWVIEGNPITFPIAYALGVEPLQSGGFALSAALEFTRSGGASEIVLCGADLGYPSGHAYANGAGWYGLSVEREDGRLKFEGRADRDETHRASGVPPLPRDRPLFDVPAWGGQGTIPTVVEFVEQRDWIAAWAATSLRRWPDCTVANASAGGADIAGIPWETPEAVFLMDEWAIGHADDADAYSTRANHDAARTLLLAQASAARRISEHITKSTPWPDPAAMGAPMQIIHALAQREIGALREAGLTIAETLPAHYAALERAAGLVEELLR